MILNNESIESIHKFLDANDTSLFQLDGILESFHKSFKSFIAFDSINQVTALKKSSFTGLLNSFLLNGPNLVNYFNLSTKFICYPYPGSGIPYTLSLSRPYTGYENTYEALTNDNYLEKAAGVYNGNLITFKQLFPLNSWFKVFSFLVLIVGYLITQTITSFSTLMIIRTG